MPTWRDDPDFVAWQEEHNVVYSTPPSAHRAIWAAWQAGRDAELRAVFVWIDECNAAQPGGQAPHMDAMVSLARALREKLSGKPHRKALQKKAIPLGPEGGE